MQVHQVRYFLAICQEHSFTRAARSCGVAQPTVTSAIKLLEREFGGALFYRKPRVELTPRGQAVHPYLCRIVEAADLAQVAAGKLDSEHTKQRVEKLEVSAGP